MQTYARHALLVLALSGLCFANPAPSDGEAHAKKTHGKKKPVAVKAVTQDEFKQLKDAFAAQQQQLDSLYRRDMELELERLKWQPDLHRRGPKLVLRRIMGAPHYER